MSGLDRSFTSDSSRYFSPSTNSKSPQQMPSAFGEKTYVNKEDHDKERTRLMVKIEEMEKKLKFSETMNSEMMVTRAELKKRIMEMEKAQKPMMEANRKLSDRSKMLQNQVKKCEQQLGHTKDDFLTLKDAHERLTKENVVLKEKRVSPETLEDLVRYRNKVLEYSKCITSLRAMVFEKDNRYKSLLQKVKRLQHLWRKSQIGANEDDRMSHVGSDSGSIDTITDTLDESFTKDVESNYQALFKENTELQKALNEIQLSTDLSEESYLRDQINFAHSTIEQQQIVIDATQDMMPQLAQLKSTIANQQNSMNEMEDEIEALKQQLATYQESQELHEFEILEMQENSKFQNQLRASIEQENEKLKSQLTGLKQQIENQGNFEEVKDLLQKSESTNVELNGEIRTLSKELSKLRSSIKIKENEVNREKKMTTALSDQLQAKCASSIGKDDEMKNLKTIIEEQKTKISQLEQEKNECEKKFKQICEEYEKYRSEQRPEIRTELERRYEETKYRLSEALEKIRVFEMYYDCVKKAEIDPPLCDRMANELVEVKEFNSQLERQFTSQSVIIEKLKERVCQHRAFCEKVNKLAEIDNANLIQEELMLFAKENDCDDAKLASNIVLIIKEIRKDSFYSPLEISTAHHKICYENNNEYMFEIRPYSSVESTEWQSNSSEGVMSPDEHDV